MKIKLQIQDNEMPIECKAALAKAISKITEQKEANFKLVDEFERYFLTIDNKLTEAHQLFIGLITEPEGFVRLRYKNCSIAFLLKHKAGVWVLDDVHRQYGDMQVGAKSVTLYLNKNHIAKEAEKKLGKIVYFG